MCLTVILSLSLPAHAASFNCNIKTLNSIEKTICETPNLSQWDDKVSNHYRVVLGIHKKNTRVKQNQKKWIKWRNTLCTPSKDMVMCLGAFYRFAYYRLENSRGYSIYQQDYQQSCINEKPMNAHHAFNCIELESAHDLQGYEEKITDTLEHYFYYLEDKFERLHPYMNIPVKAIVQNIITDYGAFWESQEKICDLSGGHSFGRSGAMARGNHYRCRTQFIEIFKDYASKTNGQKGPG